MLAGVRCSHRRTSQFSEGGREARARSVASPPFFGRESSMGYTKQIVLLLMVAASLLLLAACGQKTNCSGISFGNGSGGGSSAGGVSSGGSVCGPGSNNGGSANDFFFYHGS